ncbi:MAG TPA: transglutaminase domain-containing protein [Thermoleophilaceae bacterium]
MRAHLALDRARRGYGAEGSLALRLAAFWALLAFAAGHWVGFVADPPVGRAVLAVAIATAAGGALAASARVSAPRPLRVALRVLIAVVGLNAGLLAIGLEPRFLLPGHWDELAVGVDGGLAGTASAGWPYDGDDAWLRLTVLLGLPTAGTLAAVLAFWPARRGTGVLRAAALILIVALYALAVTERGLGEPVGRGLVLLGLAAAWLWLPRLRGRDAAAAAVALLVAAAVAIPVSTGLHEREGWVAYENWALFGNDGRGDGSTFDWSHNYGPIDWPRDGKTLLRVRSEHSHYWKAETLDHFDGLRWLHSTATTDIDAQSDVPEDHRRSWDERIGFEVEALRSGFLVTAGTVWRVGGDLLTAESGDGTIELVDEELGSGDNYGVYAYVPDPSARQMRRAPRVFPSQFLSYTTLELPEPGETALGEGAPKGPYTPDPAQVVRSFLPGTPLGADPETRARIEASPYARTYALARRLAAGQPTSYDVVKRIERYFEHGFVYNERPPVRAIPLDGFLFRDRNGYCQQFSGAMALLLRMNGIPARVAAGFSPGIRDQETGEYRVRDYDAHSWVEVFFTGIGWVPFDPTPSLSPAAAQASDARQASASQGGSDRGDTAGISRPVHDVDLSGGGAEEGGKSSLWIALALVLALPLAVLGGLWVVALVRARRVRRSGGDPDVRELVWALDRLGHPVAPGTTLLGLERRLAGIGGPAAARHARALRQRRFAPPGPVRDAAGLDRRALRRALTRGRGPLTRVRALMALPPRRPPFTQG